MFSLIYPSLDFNMYALLSLNLLECTVSFKYIQVIYQSESESLSPQYTQYT